jgi:hypothetical protein
MKPEHLFVVGAQRAGTTYLYYILNNHPQIEMNRSIVPEPKFFLESGSEHRAEEYKRQFFSNPSVSYWGDKSASYMEFPETAERIAKCFPTARILFILRDPVARAVSHFRYSSDNGVETLPMEVVFADQTLQFRPYDSSKISVSPYQYLERGKYVSFIDAYAKHFSKEQIKILVFEEFVGNESKVKELYRYLGVADNFVPNSLHERVNLAAKKIDPLSPKLCAKLAEYFRESIEELSEKYDVNTSKWNCGPSPRAQRD